MFFKRTREPLTQAQEISLAKRLGGKQSFGIWHFKSANSQRVYYRLIAARRTRETFFGFLFRLATEMGGLFMVALLALFCLVLVGIWFWGAYQTLMWTGIVSPTGSGYLTKYYFAAALAWTAGNIFAFLHKLGIGTMLLVGVLGAAYVFMNVGVSPHAGASSNAVQPVTQQTADNVDSQ